MFKERLFVRPEHVIAAWVAAFIGSAGANAFLPFLRVEHALAIYLFAIGLFTVRGFSYDIRGDEIDFHVSPLAVVLHLIPTAVLAWLSIDLVRTGQVYPEAWYLVTYYVASVIFTGIAPMFMGMAAFAILARVFPSKLDEI